MAIQTFAKSIIRRLLIQPDSTLPILRGPNRGLRMVGAPLSNAFSTAEPHLQRIISARLRQGMVVFDVGAHVGFFTLMLSRAVGQHGHVFAFEPIPTTYATLRRNLELNSVENVSALNIGLSNEEREVIFREPRGTPSMASYVWHSESTDVIEHRVFAMCVDYHKELTARSIDFIKIDVEGAEGDVLMGMRQLITRDRPVIFTECSDIGRSAAWELLTSLRYQCYFARYVKTLARCFADYRHDDFLWLPE